MSQKPSNPKDIVGTRKAPMSTVSAAVLAELGVAMLEGAAKYGRHNYRSVGVRASVYYDATLRHLFSWWEGESMDPDSGMSHITKAIASLVVLRDAMIQEMLTDDRAPCSKPFYPALNTVAGLILDRHADKEPRHFTIADSVAMTEHNDRETDSRLISESNASVARRFRHKDGFADDVAYVQVQANGDTYLVRKNGFSEKSRAYCLESCLAFVDGGDWIELEAA